MLAFGDARRCGALSRNEMTRDKIFTSKSTTFRPLSWSDTGVLSFGFWLLAAASVISTGIAASASADSFFNDLIAYSERDYYRNGEHATDRGVVDGTLDRVVNLNGKEVCPNESDRAWRFILSGKASLHSAFVVNDNGQVVKIQSTAKRRATTVKVRRGDEFSRVAVVGSDAAKDDERGKLPILSTRPVVFDAVSEVTVCFGWSGYLLLPSTVKGQFQHELFHGEIDGVSIAGDFTQTTRAGGFALDKNGTPVFQGEIVSGQETHRVSYSSVTTQRTNVALMMKAKNFTIDKSLPAANQAFGDRPIYLKVYLSFRTDFDGSPIVQEASQ